MTECGEQKTKPVGRVACDALSGTNAATLRIAERLVTLRDVERKLEGIQELIVPARCVVTPAVKDLLRQLGVRVSVGQQVANDKAGRSVALGTVGACRNAKSLEAALVRDGWKVSKVESTELKVAVSELSDNVLSNSQPAVLVIDDVDAALCLANRRAGIRAIAVRDPARVEAAAKSVGANMLLLDGAAWSVPTMARMVRLFTADGLRTCPEHLADQLA